MSNSKKHKSRRVKLKARAEKTIFKFQKIILNAIMEDIIAESDSISKIEFESKILARWKDFGRAISETDQSRSIKSPRRNADSCCVEIGLTPYRSRNALYIYSGFESALAPHPS
jgi:hypothetical protein